MGLNKYIKLPSSRAPFKIFLEWLLENLKLQSGSRYISISQRWSLTRF
jgi:hypothetical protein